MKNFGLIDTFSFRTPLLSWDEIEEFLQLSDRNEQIVWMQKTLSEPIVLEALYIASANVYRLVQEWLKGELNDPERTEDLLLTFTKYLCRMGTRSTPFGYFAGPSLGTWGKETTITLPPRDQILRKISLDQSYLFNTVQTLLKTQPECYQYLSLLPNTTLQPIGDKAKYVNHTYAGNNLHYGIQSVRLTEYLEGVLHFCQRGKRIAEIAPFLQKYEVSEVEAREYIQGLIENQILITELTPCFTDGYPFTHFSKKMQAIAAESQTEPWLGIAADCLRIERQIANLEGQVTQTPEQDYPLLRFETITSQQEVRQHFQAGMVKLPLEAKLSYKMAAAIRKGAAALNRLTILIAENDLTVFKQKFRDRFETASVPLLEALDPESGIHYQASGSVKDNNPLIDDIRFNYGSDPLRNQFPWTKAQSILLEKILAARESGVFSIALTPADLQELPADWENVPDTTQFTGRMVQFPEAEDQHALHLISGSFSSAGSIFNRFTHLHPDFQQLGDRIVEMETELAQDYLIAEVIHLPDYTRIGNILQRSVKRQYEVPFMALSGQDEAGILPLHDLTLSIRHNRLVIWSQQHDKEVRIRLSHSHNYRLQTHPVYHFLGDLQFQDQKWPNSFTWGPLERLYKFMPRVCYEGVVLKPATWSFVKKDYQSILGHQNPSEGIKQFRDKWMIPRQIEIMQFDNTLLIDFDNPFCEALFLEALHKHDQLVLDEFLPPSTQFAPKDEAGRSYCNELMAFFHRNEPITARPLPNTTLHKEVQRSFLPGGEWVYFKLYTGTKNADYLLTKCIKPLGDTLLGGGMIDKWFFIRYADPDFHIRIRFHLTDKTHFQSVCQQFHAAVQPQFENKYLFKVQIDTYTRELERYGAEVMDVSETFFFYDSLFSLAVLDFLNQFEDPESLRWKYLLLATDSILEDFGLSLAEKHALMQLMDVTRRYGITQQLNHKYRPLRPELEQLLKGKELSPVFQQIQAIQGQKAGLCRPLAQQIKENLIGPLNEYLISVIHMTLNRLCLSRPNEHEYIVYNFLSRHYQSQLARQRKKETV